MKHNWSDAAASTSYEADVLWTLVRRHEDCFRRNYKSAYQEIAIMDPAKRPEHIIAAQKALPLVDNRLRLNVDIFNTVLMTNPFRRFHKKLTKLQLDLG